MFSTRLRPEWLESLSLCAVLLVGVSLAWHNRFVQDDAFISFQYARAWASGDGLTWFGTAVEGYSNFLWVAWISLGFLVGYSPIDWSYIGGLTSYMLTILGLALATRIVPDFAVRILIVGSLVINYSVSSYATGGLETMFTTCLTTASVLMVTSFHATPAPTARSAIFISLIFATSFLNRMDAAVPILALTPFLLARAMRQEPGHRRRLFVSLCAPAIGIAGPWLIWKYAYFGAILPNTFFVKTGGGPVTWLAGIRYVARFSHAYALWPLFLVVGILCAVRALRGPAGPRGPVLPVVAVVIGWLAYVTWVGGDFMEYRMMVVVTPMILVLLGWLVARSFSRRSTRIGAMLLTLVITGGASYHHATTFKGITDDKTLDSISALSTCYGLYPDGNWSRLGLALARDLGSGERGAGSGERGAGSGERGAGSGERGRDHRNDHQRRHSILQPNHDRRHGRPQ